MVCPILKYIIFLHTFLIFKYIFSDLAHTFYKFNSFLELNSNIPARKLYLDYIYWHLWIWLNSHSVYIMWIKIYNQQPAISFVFFSPFLCISTLKLDKFKVANKVPIILLQGFITFIGNTRDLIRSHLRFSLLVII